MVCDRALVYRWVRGKVAGCIKDVIDELGLSHFQVSAYLGYCYVEHYFGIRCKIIALCSVGA